VKLGKIELGIDWDADKKIRDLILSWRPLLRLILILLTLITVTPIALFIHKLIYNLYYAGNYYLYQIAYYTGLWFYHFSYVNVRFGGFILLALFLIFKKDRIADIILSYPIAYPRLRINNIWLRIIIYFSVIISFGFALHAFRISVGMTNSPFAFQMGIFDFLTKTFFAPISEEIYTRFLILYITAALFGRIPAVLISTFVFAISHDLSQPIEILWATTMGLTNAFLTIAYGTLWPAIGIHIINNLVVYFSHPS